MVPICPHLAERKVVLGSHAHRNQSSGISNHLAAIPPLPGGEGRGEGERKKPFHFLFRVFLWLTLFLTPFLSSATDTANSDALLNRWFAAQASLQSWSADFTQTRSLKVLAEPLVATGHVWVTPNHFRWELGQPPQTIALRLPDQLFIIYPRLKRAEKYAFSAAPSGPVKDALSLLDASFPRDRATMESQFRVLSAVETNSILQVTLQPKSSSARKFIGQILIGVSTSNFTIAMTEMRFADGSTLRNDFTNVVLNQSVAPAKFEPNLGPDYTIVEPLRQ